MPRRKWTRRIWAKLERFGNLYTDVHLIKYMEPSTSSGILAERYNVSASNITAIRRNEIWKHI